MGRVIRLAVMVSATSGTERPKSLAIAETQKTSTKKSKASMVHPRKPVATALRMFLDSATVVAAGIWTCVTHPAASVFFQVNRGLIGLRGDLHVVDRLVWGSISIPEVVSPSVSALCPPHHPIPTAPDPKL